MTSTTACKERQAKATRAQRTCKAPTPRPAGRNMRNATHPTFTITEEQAVPFLALCDQLDTQYQNPTNKLTGEAFVNAITQLAQAVVSGNEQCTCGRNMWPTRIGRWFKAEPGDTTGWYATDVTAECIVGHAKELEAF